MKLIELGTQYLTCKDEEETARQAAQKIMEEIETLCPHKVGEIIKWIGFKRMKVGLAHDSYWTTGDKVEKRAMLSKVQPDIFKTLDGEVKVNFIYTFRHITSKGNLGHTSVVPEAEFEWTREMYENPNKKDYTSVFEQFKNEHPDWDKYGITDSLAWDLMDWYDIKHNITPDLDEDGEAICASDEAHEFARYIWTEILGLEW